MEAYSVDAYNKRREALLRKEKGYGFEIRAVQGATEVERTANAIVERLRRSDELDVYGKKTDKTGRKRAPADHFLGNVELINQTELFRVAQKMPKGAHLHCHFNACLPPDFLVREARGREHMYIKSSIPLVSDPAYQEAEIQFQILLHTNEDQQRAIENAPNVNIFDASYEKDSWMSYPAFCERFPGGYSKTEEWLVSRMLLTEEEIHSMNQTGFGCWARFNILTRMMKGLFGYETAFRKYTKQCIQSFIEDGIQYAEVRPNFPSNFLAKDDGSGTIDNTGLLHIIADEVDKAKKDNPFFGGLKVIYCCPRSFSNERVETALNECIELKTKFPELLCGFDLVGAEDAGRPLKDFTKELLEFRQKCDHGKLDIPFLFHAGETLSTGGDTDENLFDAILLKAKRIGHGFALPKHPLALEMIKEQNIAIETCPISNEILHLCPTIEGHSLPILLANNVHCTVNSDNGTYYRSTLSHDFYQVMIGSKSMSLHGWRVLAEWSLEHSIMSDKERKTIMAAWKRNWNDFCEWIVAEYSGKYDDIEMQTE